MEGLGMGNANDVAAESGLVVRVRRAEDAVQFMPSQLPPPVQVMRPQVMPATPKEPKAGDKDSGDSWFLDVS